MCHTDFYDIHTYTHHKKPQIGAVFGCLDQNVAINFTRQTFTNHKIFPEPKMQFVQSAIKCYIIFRTHFDP